MNPKKNNPKNKEPQRWPYYTHHHHWDPPTYRGLSSPGISVTGVQAV
jgi:hypothetical protein